MGCRDRDVEGTWTCGGYHPTEFYYKSDNDKAGYWSRYTFNKISVPNI